jgi:ATP-dependent Lon protease
MTGEVTLRGRVLPIGGLKEKALAAKRMGIHRVIIPKRNRKDLEDIPKYIKKDMEFIFAETVDDVFKAALKKTVDRKQKAAVTRKRDKTKKVSRGR